MAEIILTNENFDSEVLKSDKPVLIDFWASWCGPCMMMSPIVSAISEELADKIKVAKVNVDENPDLAEKYGIMSIPCFMIFKNGQQVATTVGARGKDDLKSFALQN